MLIPTPDTLEEARAFIGTRVAILWPEYGNRWFEGTVVAVDSGTELTPDAATPDDVADPTAFYCLIRYPPQYEFLEEDTVDTEWDAVFISPDTARILDLPRGVRAAFPQFVPRTCPAPPRGPVTPARGGKGKGNAPATGSGRLGRACDGEEAQAARPRKKARQGSGARERTAAEAAAADGEEGALARFLASQQQQQQQQQQPQPQQPPAALHAPGAREQANGVHADGSDSGSDGEAPPSPQRRGRPAAHVGRQRPPPVGRQRLPPDYSHVPDPEGAPLAGRLKRLQLQHFVCHEHLDFEMPSRATVLTGVNGAGKSAVLAALQCALGARAADTGRYKTLQSFVQRPREGDEGGGPTQAVIRVTIWNTGEGAYRRAALGPYFTVSRRIYKSGKGSFEILDHTGRVAFTGSKEVAALVEALGINVTNPANVLTQDMARCFAGEKTDKDRFQGFMEALEFDRTRDCLKEANERIERMDVLLGEVEGAMAHMQAELQGKQDAIEHLREVGAWQAQHTKLSTVCAWAPVYAYERDLAKRRDALETTLPARQAACAARVASFRQQLRGIEAQLDGQQQRLQEADTASQACLAELQRLREDVKAQKARARSAQQELRATAADAQALRDEQEALEAANREVAADFARSTADQMAEHRARVAACRDQAERAGVATSGARQSLGEAVVAAEQAKAAERIAAVAVRDAETRAERLQADLHRLVASQEHTLARFGGLGIMELHAAVQRAVAARRFHDPPILLGAVLSLADEQWATAVEAAMGSKLDNWVVGSYADQAVLKSLRRELRTPLKSFNTIVYPFNTPQYVIPPPRKLPEGVVTVLSVLRFADTPRGCGHVARNVLFDHAHIERTVLTHTQSDALGLLRDRGFWNRYSIHAAFAQDGSQARLRGNSEILLPPDRYRSRPRLVADATQHLVECRRELEHAQARLAELQVAERAAHGAATAAVQEHAAAKRQLQEATQAKAAMDSQYQEALIRQPLDFGGGAGTGETMQRLAQLGRGVLEAEVQRDLAADSLKSEQDALARLVARQHELRAGGMQAEEDTLEECRRSIADLDRGKRELQGALADAEKDEGETLMLIGQLRHQVHTVENELTERLQTAEQHCPRDQEAVVRQELVAAWRAEGQSDEGIAAQLGEAELAHRIEALERRIATKREAVGLQDSGDLEIEVRRLRERLRKTQAQFDAALNIYDVLEKGGEIRKRKFKEVRTTIAHALSLSFRRYMSYRGYHGTIDVDYRQGRLSFKVGQQGQAATRDVKSLSGGERSLVSLAFILALGHVGVNPPFHALDEFDIFMDAANRRLGLAFLLEYAYRQPDCQLLLLTPQDTSVVNGAQAQVEDKMGPLPEGFIKVRRLPPPRER